MPLFGGGSHPLIIISSITGIDSSDNAKGPQNMIFINLAINLFIFLSLLVLVPR